MGNTGSATSNPFIPATIQMQELERLQFSQNLRKNPAEYSAYVNQRIGSMTKEIADTKDNAFRKAQIDLSRYMDMDHNSKFYSVRNKDVNRLMDSIAKKNAAVVEGVTIDKQNSKRQFEINEWYNNNKLETLFFLQMFFVASLIMIILVSLQKRGTIGGPLAATLSGIIAVAVGFVGLYRYYYTEATRDTRLWNRRRFGTTTAPPPAAPDCPRDVEDEDDTYMNDIAQGVGACASVFGASAKNGADSIKQLGADINAEAIHAVSTGKIDFDYKGALNKVCPGAMD